MHCTLSVILGFKPRTSDHAKVKVGVQVPIIVNAVSRSKGQRSRWHRLTKLEMCHRLNDKRLNLRHLHLVKYCRKCMPRTCRRTFGKLKVQNKRAGPVAGTASCYRLPATIRSSDSHHCKISRTSWKLTSSEGPFFLFISSADALELD